MSGSLSLDSFTSLGLAIVLMSTLGICNSSCAPNISRNTSPQWFNLLVLASLGSAEAVVATMTTIDSQPIQTTPYTPLVTSRRQIRLLQLKSDRVDGKISGTLQTYDLGNIPNYYALSYAWVRTCKPSSGFTIDHSSRAQKSTDRST